jgi:hypothetical protein
MSSPEIKKQKKGVSQYSIFQTPTPGYHEQVFYHNLRTDDAGKTFAALINPLLKLGIAIRFDKTQLCRFTQWKQMGEGEYVLGLEPSNCHVEGRAKARQDETLEYIKPGEMRSFDIELRIIDGDEEINKAKEAISCMP